MQMIETLEQAVDEMMQRFPEVSRRCSEIIHDWEGLMLPTDIIFSEVFAVHLLALVADTKLQTQTQKIKQATAFIEEMLDSRAFDVRSTAEVSIIEKLLTKPELYERIKPFCGLHTIEIADSIWQRWKSTIPL